MLNEEEVPRRATMERESRQGSHPHSTLNIQHSTFNIELFHSPARPLIEALLVAEPWATSAVGRADCDTRHILV
jgi:hypothetical protein